VRCGPHQRAELEVLSEEDISSLYKIWSTYRDDLRWPWYEKKPEFSDEDHEQFEAIAQKVVDAMIEEYNQPMVLDQATVSNTNHIGHPPHADNVQFDSVWWKGKRIRAEDEVDAAQGGAYVLWRPEKTSYRSYGATISLVHPDEYEGGEVEFFSKWGDKEPLKSYKCEKGRGVAFCGCQRNIHAVKGVKSGFRLVFLVWTRPPAVRVPDSQQHVCYFRPGTGNGVWLTTADLQRRQARKRGRDMMAWVPKDEDDDTCECERCLAERKKVAWKDCCKGEGRRSPPPGDTPATSAGNSPRTSEQNSSEDCHPSSSSEAGEPPSQARSRVDVRQHCPHQHGRTDCSDHGRREMGKVLSSEDMDRLRQIWDRHHDDLTHPWYKEKPKFSDKEFLDFRRIATDVVKAMSEAMGEPLELDQATVSNTNRIGHPPHADNVQFDSVWWDGQQIKQRDELAATRDGAHVLWKDSKTNYRNYSATVALSEPWEYGGGDLEFFRAWGEKEPCETYRQDRGDGMVFCGCQKNIHAVTGVKWGFRLVLLVWTRRQGVPVPDGQGHVCYFRPGTGMSVWLTSEELEKYPQRRKPELEGQEEDEEEDKEEAGADTDSWDGYGTWKGDGTWERSGTWEGSGGNWEGASWAGSEAAEAAEAADVPMAED